MWCAAYLAVGLASAGEEGCVGNGCLVKGNSLLQNAHHVIPFNAAEKRIAMNSEKEEMVDSSSRTIDTTDLGEVQSDMERRVSMGSKPQAKQRADDGELGQDDVAEESMDLNDRLANSLQIEGNEVTACAWHDAVCKANELINKVVNEIKDKGRKISDRIKEEASKAYNDAKKKLEEVENKARAQVKELQEGIKKAKAFIENMLTANKGLEQFSKCLQGLPKKYHFDHVVKLFGDSGGDPKKLFDSLKTNYFDPAIASLSQFADNQIRYVNNVMTDLNGISSLSQLEEKLGGIMDKSLESMKYLFTLEGFEVGGCIAKFILTPEAIAEIKKVARNLFQLLKEQLVKPMEKIQKNVAEVVAKMIEDASKKVWEGDEGMKKLATISRDAASAACMETVNSTTTQLRKLLANPSEQQIKKLNNTLQGSPLDFPKVAAKALLGLLRVWVKQLQTDVIDPLIRSGLDVIKSISTPVLNTIDGLCGLIPYVGGGICAFFTTLTGTAEVWLHNLQQASVKKIVNGALMGLVDKAEEFVETAFEHVEVKGLEWLKPVAEIVRKLATQLIPGVKKRLAECNAQKDGVFRLVNVAMEKLKNKN